MNPNPWRWRSVSVSVDDKQKAYAAILHVQPADFLRSDQTNSGILQCFDGGGAEEHLRGVQRRAEEAFRLAHTLEG